MTPSAAWKRPAVWSSAASHPLKGAEWHHLDSGRLSSAVLWGCLAYGKESPISTHPTGERLRLRICGRREVGLRVKKKALCPASTACEAWLPERNPSV